MMPLAMLAPKGLTVLFVVTALAALAWSRHYREPFQWPSLSILLPFAAFIGYAMVSAIWSPTPLVSLKSAISLGLVTFGGLMLASFALRLETPERRVLTQALVVGAILALLLLSLENLIDTAIWRWIMALKDDVADIPETNRSMVVYNSAMSVGALFIYPLLLLWRSERPLLAIFGVLLALLIMFLSEAEVPALAVLISLMATLFFWRVRATIVIALGAVIIVLFAAPLIPGKLPGLENIRAEMPYLSHSAVHRIVIWKTAVKHIAETPVAGLGMNTSRSLYDKQSRVTVIVPPAEAGGRVWSSFFEPIPLHPHNGVLQIWLELGAVGIAILVWIIITLVRAARNRLGHSPRETALVLGFYVSSLTIASLSFGAWQSWWVCTLWLAASLLVAQLPASKQ